MTATLAEAPYATDETPLPAVKDGSAAIPPETIRRLAAVFKLLADRSRLRIVLALARNGPMHVSALVKMLAQTQPAVSHHLALMREEGLLGRDRSGKHNYYYLASDFVACLLEQFFRDAGDAGDVGAALRLDSFSLHFARRDA